MIPLSASKVWLRVQRDGGTWSFLTWTRSHLSLHRHPETSREVVEETLLILPKNQCDFLLELVDAVSRWMFSGLEFDSSIFDWKNKFSFFIGKYHLFRIASFWVDFRCVHRLELLSSLQPVRHPSQFHPWTMRTRGTIQVIFSFQIDGFLAGLSYRVILDQWTKWYDRFFIRFSRTYLTGRLFIR